MPEIEIATWIVVAWILTGVALLLAILGYRRRVLEFLVLLLLILLQIALLGAWTVGATAEAAWQGEALVFRSSTVIDPAFALWYSNVVFWFAVGVLVLLLLAAVIRRRITRQDRQDFRMRRALRVSAFLVELVALVVMAGPLNLSNGQPLPALKGALSPDATRQMQVVVVRSQRKYGFLPGTGRKTLTFLHRPTGKWLWQPVGHFGSPGDVLSLEKENIREARCDWLEDTNRVRILLDMPGKTFDGWVCLLDYDYAAGKQLPVRPETQPVTKPAVATKPVVATKPAVATKPKVPPATKPKAPPATKPKAPPVVKPKVPPATKPKAPPVVKPKVPPATKPKAPPVVKPKVPSATKPKAPPVVKPKVPPATKPKAPPATKPKAPPATKPKAPPVVKPKVPPATKPKAPPATNPKAPPAVTGEKTEAARFFGFTLNADEYQKLKPYKRCFSTRAYRVGEVKLEGGTSIAVWRDQDAVVTGREKIKINWLIPDASRTAFEAALKKTPAVMFQLRCYTREGALVVSYAYLKKKAFASKLGNFTIQTPGATVLKGKSDAYLLLYSDDMKVMNNIIRITLNY